MLGYCMSCQRLTAIKPVAQKWGSRECEYRPTPHDRPVHRGCGGIVMDLDESANWPARACAKCGVSCFEDDVERVPCDGDTRDIR